MTKRLMNKVIGQLFTRVLRNNDKKPLHMEVNMSHYLMEIDGVQEAHHVMYHELVTMLREKKWEKIG